MTLSKMRFLDDTIDLVAQDANGALIGRLIIILVTLGFLPFIVGISWALTWPPAALAALWWMWIASRSLLAAAVSQRLLLRLNYFASIIASGLIWSILPFLYWRAGGQAERMAAVVIVLTQLLNAQIFMFRSKALYAVAAGPPSLCLLYLMTAVGDLSSVRLLFALAVSLSAIGYLVMSAGQAMAADGALREAERTAVAANQAKSLFLAMASHELRTPLNGLLGMARALSLMPMQPQAKAHVATMVQSGASLQNMLNDILDFSKIEAGKMTLNERAFSLASLVEEVTELWRDAAQTKGLSLQCDPVPEDLNWLTGDADRLRQILLNLISNALKFTDAGGVRVSVRRTPESDGDGALGLTVAICDTGVGLTKDQIARLFVDFAQVGTVRSNLEGTGLGLSICSRLAGLMGGDIIVESQPGCGSTFFVRLRLPAAEPACESLVNQCLDHDFTRLRVLVVEDNLVNQTVVRAILEAWGAHIEVANNGAEGLERLAHEGFDLVLMDLQMPVMGGAEAIGRIRAGQAGRRDIPVIALTADGQISNRQSILALGFSDVQSKPIELDALAGSIAQVLNPAAVPPANSLMNFTH